jgi:hypothetical protein
MDLVKTGAGAGSVASIYKAIRTPKAEELKTAEDYTKRLKDLSKDIEAMKGVRFPKGYSTATFDGEKTTFMDRKGNLVREVEEAEVKALEKKVKTLKETHDSLVDKRAPVDQINDAWDNYQRALEELGDAEDKLRKANNGRVAASKLNKLKQRGLIDDADIEGAKRADIIKNTHANAKAKLEQMYKDLQKVKVDDQKAFKKTLDDIGEILKKPSLSATDLKELELKTQKLTGLIEGSKKVLVSNVPDNLNRWKRFWAKHPKIRTLAKGLFCTAASQAGGSLAFAAYWGASGKLGTLDEVQGGYIDASGECVADPNFEFHKNQTYRITIQSDSTGKRTIMICELKAEDLEKEEIDNSRRLDKCDGKFLKKESPSSKSAKAENIKEIIERVAAKKGVDPKLIEAIIQRESSFNRFAVSKKGAVGLMQVMPPHFCEQFYPTVQEFSETGVQCFDWEKGAVTPINTGVPGAAVVNAEDVIPKGIGEGIPPSKWFDPEINIGLGVDVLKSYLESPSIASCSNKERLALAMYNGGPNAVKDCSANYSGEHATAVLSTYEKLKGA